MSTAALTSETLGRQVRDHVKSTDGDLAGVSTGLQRAVARTNVGAWRVLARRHAPPPATPPAPLPAAAPAYVA